MRRQFNAQYRPVAHAVLVDIEAGLYKHTERLSVPRMAEFYGVHVETMRRAIRFLRDRDIVRTHNRNGHYLNKNPPVVEPATIKEALQTYAITYQELARRTDVSLQHMSRLMRGDYPMSASWRKKINNAINEIRKEDRETGISWTRRMPRQPDSA